jgi:hypothetical protein
VAVRSSDENAERVTATVFVPDAQRDYYLRKIEAYRTEETPSGKPKNAPLVAAIEAVRLAAVRSLFTDSADLFPAPGQPVWWELWLRKETRPTLELAAQRLGIALRPHSVAFAEREVMVALAPVDLLARIVAHSDTVAELRIARDTPAFFVEIPSDDQRQWTEDALARLTPPAADAPAVCLLDSGTTRRHPLIRPALDPPDQQAWDGAPSVEDISGTWLGHGTEMSGIAAAAGPDDGWFLGPRLRDRGSLIADVWEGTASDLGSRHAIAIYPIGGWWKEKAPLRRYERQVHYSLIVSLRAPQGIDLYTPIQNSIAIQTPVTVGIPI